MSSAFLVDTHELGRRAGSMTTLQREVAAPDPMGSEVIAVPAGGPIALDLRLEAVSEGVLVTGTARTRARGECVRCLREVEEDVAVDVTELFLYAADRRRGAVVEDEESEALPELDGDQLDLQGTLTDAIVLALPFKPLCRPDCQGLCAECGVRLDDAEPGHAHEQLDPRWSALAALAAVGGGDAARDAAADDDLDDDDRHEDDGADDQQDPR